MLNKNLQLFVLAIAAATMLLGGCASRSEFILAIDNGDLTRIQELIKSGANVNARSGYHYYDPTWAANNDDVQAAVSMVKETTVDNSMTVLMLAVQRGHINTVKLLLDKEADVNANDYFGKTALIVAAENGYADIIKYLLDRGSDVNIKDKYGTTALMAACENAGSGKMSVGKSPDGNVSMSLSLAEIPSNSEILEYLLDKGADINTKDIYGGTALARAAYAGHTEAVRLLITKNADLNTKRKDGCTALILAAEGNHLEIVRVLLSANADFQAINNVGKSAFDLAKTEEIKSLLRDVEAR